MGSPASQHRRQGSFLYPFGHLFRMLAEVLGAQMMSPQVALQSGDPVSPQRPQEDQPIETRQCSIQLILKARDKIVHGCFPFRLMCVCSTNIVRESKHPFSVVAAPLCGAGKTS